MKSTMKRLLGFVLVLVMVLSMMPMSALAADPTNLSATNNTTGLHSDNTTVYYVYTTNWGGNSHSSYYKVIFEDFSGQTQANLHLEGGYTLKLGGGEWAQNLYTQKNTDKYYHFANTNSLPGTGNTTYLYLRNSDKVAVTITRMTACQVLGHDWSSNDGICARFGCHHNCTHNFNNATCTAPKTCSICGKTEGSALTHDFNPATCTAPKTCKNCPATEGIALNHNWSDPTCTEPAKCSRCQIEGNGTVGAAALGHNLTYAVNDKNHAQIVESCSRCDHSATATLVFAYGEGTYDYTGEEVKPLKVEYSENWKAEKDLVIRYHNNIHVSYFYGNPYGASGTISKGDRTTAYLNFIITLPRNAWTEGPSIEGWTYGEEANAPVAAAKFGTVKVEYRPATENDKAYTKDVPTAAGQYKVRFTVEGDWTNTGLMKVVDLTIAPAKVTVTAVDGSKIYGEADPTLTYTVGTLVGEDTLTGITVARAEGENVGTYAITAAQAAGANSNYEITFVPATFTISEKEIGITWGDTTDLPYTGSSLAPAATATGLKDGDECTLTVAVVETAEGAGIVPGTWTAKVTALSNANYKLPENVETSFNIVKANQAAPAVAGVDETVDGKADGKITGVDSTMEYRKAAEAELMLLSESEYTPITGTELTGLEDGTYFVRYKGNNNYNPSPETQITIKAGGKLTVTVPETQVGYTLTTDTTELVWHGDANIAFTLAEGYSKTDAFAVKVNGTAVELDADGKYAIVDAEENIVVTVEGVADITAPTAEVAISTNKWNTFLSTIDFAIFYKTAQSVTVTAADANLDKVYYYVANAAMAEADVQAITEWTEYTAAFNIDPSNEYVVYVKAVDKSGNTTYVSSNGVVIDAIAPEITGVVNKGTYYYNTQFGASDKYLDTVTVDGKTVELKDGKYTIIADGKDHTIVATDKAGNSTTVKITVISTANAVPTGDDSNLWLWVVVLFMSAVGLTGTIAYDRKKKNVK